MDADDLGTDSLISIENLIGGEGDDTFTGNQFANIFQGGAGNDTLIGGEGDDQLFGGLGDDQLIGGSTCDTLSGGDGDDFLFGNGGTDYLTGGSGADIFQFASTDGTATITDFSSSDSDQLQFFADGDFSGLLGDWQFDTNACTTENATLLFCENVHTLYYDADGTGTSAATAIATFSNNATIAHADITVTGP